MPQSRVTLHQIPHDLDRVVGGVIQHLDIELFLRILEFAHAVDKPLGHEPLIEHRKLDGHSGQIVEVCRGFTRVVLAVFVIEINEDVAVYAVGRQKNQYDKVRNEQCDIKSVRVIQTLKCAVKKVLANIRSDPFVGDHGGNGCQIRNEQIGQPVTPTRDGSPLRYKPFILPEAEERAGAYDVFTACQVVPQELQ